MLFDLKRLRHVLAVADCGSVTIAAEQLGITQSGLSRSISTLESAWRVQLFERGPKGLRPTQTGRALLGEARALLDQARTIDHNMTLRSGGLAGQVTFGTAPLIGGILTGPLLARALGETPGVSLTATNKPLPDLMHDLKADRCDFVVFSEERLPHDDAISFAPLGAMPLAFVVRRQHPLDEAMHSSRSFARYPLAASPYLREVRIPCLSSVQCDNYHAMWQMMLETDAVCLTSPWMFRDALAAGEARILRMGDERPRSPDLYLAHVAGRLLSPAAQRVIDQARAIIRELQDAECHDPDACTG